MRIQNLASTQTATERILDKSQVPTNVIRENLLDPYLRELTMVEQNKRVPLSQKKSLFNLQRKIASIYKPLCQI